jgi:hypothetical protein
VCICSLQEEFYTEGTDSLRHTPTVTSTHPPGLPMGVSLKLESPSSEGAFRIFVWLWQIHNRSDKDMPMFVQR